MPQGNEGAATMIGLCLERLTGEFPIYQLDKIESEFHGKDVQFKNSKSKCNLPKLPKEVGGEVYIMIGIHYLRFIQRK